MIGFTKEVSNPLGSKKRRHKKERFFTADSGLKATGFRGMFRSRRY